MTNNDMSNLILADDARIVEAIATGAAWEIWMQVELCILIRQSGRQAAREVPYPPPNQAQRLDTLAQDGQGQYAIELKVESAHNAGANIMNGVHQDIVKIANYPAPNPGERWVIGIGYSAHARNALQLFANAPLNHAIYNEQGGIGVLIVDV